jgi:hypothetical protein
MLKLEKKEKLKKNEMLVYIDPSSSVLLLRIVLHSRVPYTASRREYPGTWHRPTSSVA